MQLRLSDIEKAVFSEIARNHEVTMSGWSRKQLRLAAIAEYARLGKNCPLGEDRPLTDQELSDIEEHREELRDAGDAQR